MTTFDFMISNGNNSTSYEYSLPGADGIAFVIQNSSRKAIGFMGGGLGYETIPNSIAVEFDTFCNDSLQIENYFDPNGNHIAVQSMGNKPNTSVHKPEALLGMASNILTIRPDGTIYHVKIEYINQATGTFNIYLDTNLTFGNPILSLTNFDLAKIIDLSNGGYAYLGMTAGTGFAYENHDILNWHICLNSSKILLDVPNDSQYQNNSDYFEVYPNPSDEGVDFSFSSIGNNNSQIEIFDILGNLSTKIFNDFTIQGINTIHFNTSELSPGNYICRLSVDGWQKNLILRVVR